MKQPRFAIAGMMAGVAAAALNLAVVRSFNPNKPESLSHLFFACGVMPMASVLILVALAALHALCAATVRRHSSSASRRSAG